MKKIAVVLIASVSVLLSGCMTSEVMKQMSADCAKVGGTMEVGMGIFGPSMECTKPETKE